MSDSPASDSPGIDYLRRFNLGPLGKRFDLRWNGHLLALDPKTWPLDLEAAVRVVEERHPSLARREDPNLDLARDLARDLVELREDGGDATPFLLGTLIGNNANEWSAQFHRRWVTEILPVFDGMTNTVHGEHEFYVACMAKLDGLVIQESPRRERVQLGGGGW